MVYNNFASNIKKKAETFILSKSSFDDSWITSYVVYPEKRTLRFFQSIDLRNAVPVNLLDQTFPEPEQNLACDEALLNFCEEGEAGELLRIWEPQQYFIVLGSSNKVHHEVHVDACREDGIPILRRHSGGGTVLQGPGCLNYSLILHINSEGPTRNITDTTNFIMQRHAEMLSTLLNEKVEVQGSSDLTITGKKFSGNAQRRRMKALLYHGTVLLDFNLALIEQYVKLPEKQPEYRGQRSHHDFVRNISLQASTVKKELARLWNATTKAEPLLPEALNELVRKKYSREEWNFKL